MSSNSTTALPTPRTTTTLSTIYPTGYGNFALDSPDGRILQNDQEVETLLGGHWITGVIECPPHGYPHFTAHADNSVCGLYAGMRIRFLTCKQDREEHFGRG